MTKRLTFKEALLAEARTWGDDEEINWSNLASKYGLTSANRGQTLKEYLKDQNIPAAMKTHGHSMRRKRKSLPGGIPFPMQRPSTVHKRRLVDLMQSENSTIDVVPTTTCSYTYSEEDKALQERTLTVYSKKIPLVEIRRKLLHKHEQMGLMRNHTTSVTRFLKVWHDHSSVGGHGHLLVLVSVIYDSSLYYTSKEVEINQGKKIDVQSTVEAPEVHIFGRSTSSLEDQALFLQCRNECLEVLSTPLKSNTGMEVNDVLRYFHGDGPAAQFEAGNSVGGNFSCVGCGARTVRFDDLAYSYRSEKLTLQSHQQFLLKGIAWKNIPVRPLDKLLLTDLQKELQARRLLTKGKKKPVLEKDFEDMKYGITNFPALLQSKPKSSLSSLNLDKYEVSPTEPLHDLKGHLANIITETLHITSGNIHSEVSKIKKSVLKDTVRCSDL